MVEHSYQGHYKSSIMDMYHSGSRIYRPHFDGGMRGGGSEGGGCIA